MVTEPSLQLVCSRAREVVPVAPTPIEVEAYDSDHETSDQVTLLRKRLAAARVLGVSVTCGPVLLIRRYN